MRRSVKRLLRLALYPFALASMHLLPPLRRAWWHALLRARICWTLPADLILLSDVEVHGSGDIQIGGNGYFFPGTYLETQGSGRIRIGRGVVLSRGVHIVAFDLVEIGDGTMIGEYSSIRDANHHRENNVSLRMATHTARPIRIGKEVWIGRGCAVLGGVSIGDYATAGANSVITHDIPSGETHAGVPARRLVGRVREDLHAAV
jgi:acetyltransferase-like isoleucine patch superfamily enzyme